MEHLRDDAQGGLVRHFVALCDCTVVFEMLAIVRSRIERQILSLVSRSCVRGYALSEYLHEC